MNHTYLQQTGPKSFGTAQKHTMPQIQLPDYPGPGTHQNFRFDQTNPPTWKFGYSTQRDGFLCQHTKANPPPNKYEQNPQFIKTAYPKFSIPKSSPPKEQKDQNSRMNYQPNYNYPKQKLPKYSFGYSQQIDYSTQVPPPNSYFQQPLQLTRFNKTENFFTKDKRPNPYGEWVKNPGIGQYILNQSMGGTSFKFGIGDRPDNTVAKDSPGYYYEIAGDMKKPGFGYTLRPFYKIYENKDIVQFPAPNHYNPSDLKSGKNIISFRGSRSQMHNSAILKYPSSDKYAQQSDIALLRKKNSTSFAQSQRPQLKDNGSPGPGKYLVYAKFNKTLGHMAAKLKPQTEFITPAPSQYQPVDDLTKTTPQRPINLYSDRIDFSRSQTGKIVGPGSYLKQREWCRSELGKMSVSPKLKNRDNKHPGPGSYQIPGTIGNLPKYYGLPKKLSSHGDPNLTKMAETGMERNEKLKKLDMTVQKIANARKKKLNATKVQ